MLRLLAIFFAASIILGVPFLLFGDALDLVIAPLPGLSRWGCSSPTFSCRSPIPQ
jgi:hypothetical protein